MSKPQKNESGASVSKTNIILIAALIVVTLVLIIVVIYFFKNPRVQTVQDTPTQREVLITPENVSQRIAELESHNTDSAYTTSMSIDWSFANGAAASKDAYVENDVSNSRAVYFDLVLSSTEETIYSSPIIPVGSKLKDIRLNKELSKGNYQAVVIYHLIDDDNKDISTVSVAVNLHILN